MRSVVFQALVCSAILLVIGTCTGVQDSNYSVDEGFNIHVTCNVTDDPDVTVWWISNNTSTPLFETGPELRIQNISRTQTGQYICYSHNSSATGRDVNTNQTRTEVNIEVRFPATIHTMKMTPIKVMEGDSFTVTCQVNGDPLPSITIKNKNTNSVYMTGYNTTSLSMTSHPVDCLDSGTILCTARNDLSVDNSSHSIRLNVFCSPSVDPRTVNATQPTLYARLRADTALQVRTVGYPRPIYTWSFRGQVLPATRQVDMPYRTILLFNNVSIDSYGPYILNMSNSVGSRTETFTLFPTGPPEMPTDFTVHNVTSTSVILTWVAGYDYGSLQTFKIFKMDGNSIKVMSTFPGSAENHGIGFVEHKLTRLSPSTNYTLTISSQNDNGIGAISPWLVTFETAWAPPTHGASNTPLSTGEIIGIAVGGVCIIVIIIAVVIWRRKGNYQPMLE